jgi:hypothetical protein
MKTRLLCCAIASLLCWPAFAQEHQPRTLGNTAVMHIYYYSPKTLEVTYVDSYLFKDAAACKDAINGALRIATPTASEGDLVSAQCVGMTPPKAVTEPAPKVAPGSTYL